MNRRRFLQACLGVIGGLAIFKPTINWLPKITKRQRSFPCGVGRGDPRILDNFSFTLDISKAIKEHQMALLTEAAG